MHLFDALTDEHRLITRTLDAFDVFVEDFERTRQLDPIEFNRFVVFFREFADLIHHEHEEAILFPALEALGYSRKGAPIAHISDEHERERKLLFELRQYSVRARPLSSAKLAHLVGICRELIVFEREHIKKENELLYPSVKKEFSGQTLEEVTERLWQGPPRRLVEDAWLRALSAELIAAHVRTP
jgi:hemerythrin-like domain-containing protein